jgi:hypothetical protein
VPTPPPLGFRTYFVISTVPDKRKRLAQLVNGQSEFWRENLPKFFQLLGQTNRDRWERRTAGRIGTDGMASANAVDGSGNGTNTTATISNNVWQWQGKWENWKLAIVKKNLDFIHWQF